MTALSTARKVEDSSRKPRAAFSDLTVVIPTLNEAEAIGKVIDEVLEVGVPRENVIVVDGGSTDGTVEIARSKGVRVIKQVGEGKADAIKTAAEYVRTHYMLVIDGDYTYPPKHIPELYERVRGGYDLVIGSRRFSKGSQSLIYRVGNRLLTKFFNILFGSGLTDVLSGMYLIKTRVMKHLLFESRGFGIESEVAAHVVSTSGKVTEVPIEYRRRLGKKKLGVTHGLLILREMVRLAWRYNPIFFLLAAASLLMVPGLIIGGWVAYHYIFTGIKYYVKGVVAIILTLTGFQSLLLAIVTIYLKRMEYRINRRFEDFAERYLRD